MLTESSWNRLAFQAALEGVPGYFNCHCATCNYSRIHDDEGAQNNIWRCQNPVCEARICTLHSTPYHTNETYEQYDKRKENGERVEEEEEEEEEEGENRESHLRCIYSKAKCRSRL